jgi:hypothetical protein
VQDKVGALYPRKRGVLRMKKGVLQDYAVSKSDPIKIKKPMVNVNY